MSRLRIGFVSGVALLAAASVAPAASAQDMLSTLGLNMSAPAPNSVPPAPPPAPPPQTASTAIPPAAAIPASTVPNPAPPPPGAPSGAKLTAIQLDQLLAPIALYPDPLLAQVLMASTYPLEVVEAARWVAVPADRLLAGAALTRALQAQHWAPSVMALVPFPNLLAIMSRKIQWTEAVGSAFMAQQPDVMAAVQALRREALAAGTLKATPQCRCMIKTSGGTIAILPASPQLVCLPVYSPAVAYGPWPDPAYPPVVFPVPVGFAYLPGPPIGYYPGIDLALYGPLWGWGWINWPGRDIVIDGPRYAMIAPDRRAFAHGIWSHDMARDPARRAGFAAGDRAVAPHVAAVHAHPAIAAGHYGHYGHALAARGPHRFGPAAVRGGRIGGMARPFHPAGFAHAGAAHFAGPAHVAARGGRHGGGPHEGGLHR